MATTAAPYGMIPVGHLGGLPYSGSTRLLKITNSYATSIFYGDIVKIASTGTVEKDTGTDAATPVGVFMGCTFTDPTLGYKLFKQCWVASTSATDAYAYVCDDPLALFKIQADDTLAQTTLGNNAAIVQTAGTTTVGNSKNALDASTVATTNTLPLRIVDFVDGPMSTVGDAYTDVIVKINTHFYLSTTGV